MGGLRSNNNGKYFDQLGDRRPTVVLALKRALALRLRRFRNCASDLYSVASIPPFRDKSSTFAAFALPQHPDDLLF